MKRSFSVAFEVDERMYQSLKKHAEDKSMEINSVITDILRGFLDAREVLSEEDENTRFSKLSESLDIPEENIRKFVKYLSDYSDTKNTFLYQELGNLARFIIETQKDVSRVNLKGITNNDIPETSDQLEGIIEATEEATDQILSATERLLEMVDTLEAFIDKIELDRKAEVTEGKKPGIFLNEMRDEMMKILSACNFQDLTGQRIQKIVTLIRKIESKIMDLIIWYDSSGKENQFHQQLTSEMEEKVQDDDSNDQTGSLLKGPQRKEEAFAQEDIDSLLSDLGF